MAHGCAPALTLAGLVLLLAAGSASAAVFTVNTANDCTGGGCGGQVSLRDAIAASNAGGTGNVINFSIPGTGVKTITLSNVLGALPIITRAVAIDATTQGVSATPLVVLNGQNAGGSAIGFEAQAPVAIKGFAIEFFGTVGIQLDSVPTSSAGSQIQDNFIGTDATGVNAAANGGGIFVNSSNVTFTSNLVSGNGGYGGVRVNASNVTIQGNTIGLNGVGNAALGNAGGGVAVGGPNNTIGGNTASSRNVISGNAGDGVLIAGGTAINNLVAGNYIGTDVSGAGALGNSGRGVDVNGSTGNQIAGNLIANNAGEGVFANAIPNFVTLNSSFGNGADVVVQFNPLTGEFKIVNGQFQINFSGAQSGQNVRAEAFKSRLGCQTQTFLGSNSGTADPNGGGFITINPSLALTPGDIPSILLTDDTHGTSSTICAPPPRVVPGGWALTGLSEELSPCSRTAPCRRVRRFSFRYVLPFTNEGGTVSNPGTLVVSPLTPGVIRLTSPLTILPIEPGQSQQLIIGGVAPIVIIPGRVSDIHLQDIVNGGQPEDVRVNVFGPRATVKGLVTDFITSDEYRRRFGPVSPRSGLRAGAARQRTPRRIRVHELVGRFTPEPASARNNLAPGVADPNQVVKVQVAIVRRKSTRIQEIDESPTAQAAARDCLDYVGPDRFRGEGESRPVRDKIVCEGFVWGNAVIQPRTNRWFFPFHPRRPLPPGNYTAYARAITRAGVGDPAVRDRGRPAPYRLVFFCRPRRC